MRYYITIKFSSSSFFEISDNDEIKVSLKNKPERGKANRELIKILSRYFRVSTENITIISGLNSRKKIVEIEK